VSFYDNAASFLCIIHVSILCDINEQFFGVAIPLHLFIDMSVSSEQQNTRKLSFACTQIGADSAENYVQAKPSQAKPSQIVNWGRRLARSASRRPPVC
jgi:hypothetical protein